MRRLGRELISEGKIACLVAAGGQGTRLGFKGPKGGYPISVIRNKTLFELLAEKVLAASEQAKRALLLAVMVSKENSKESRKLLEPLLPKEQLFIFEQEDLPFLDEEGNEFEVKKGKRAQGPDGNGYALHNLVNSGIYQSWEKKGVEIVNFILIDNPLADPFDPELAGHLAATKADAAIKCVERESPDEKVGVVVSKGKKVSVIEYSELQDNKEHTLANLSLFAFSMKFIKRVAKKELPLHIARKKTIRKGKEVIAQKQERFIFDVLPFSKKTIVLVYPRELCFAPLKSKEGANGPKQVKRALQKLDRITFEKLTGVAAPKKPFELSQRFYYPTKSLLTKWRGKKGGPGYIEA